MTNYEESRVQTFKSSDFIEAEAGQGECSGDHEERLDRICVDDSDQAAGDRQQGRHADEEDHGQIEVPPKDSWMNKAPAYRSTDNFVKMYRTRDSTAKYTFSLLPPYRLERYSGMV